VTGKQPDCVLFTGFPAMLPPAADPGLDRDLFLSLFVICPLLEGVIALEAPAWSRLCGESPLAAS